MAGNRNSNQTGNGFDSFDEDAELFSSNYDPYSGTNYDAQSNYGGANYQDAYSQGSSQGASYGQSGAQQGGAQYQPYVPNNANNPYAPTNGDYVSPVTNGYNAPTNPYVNGPTAGAQGFTPERIATQPKRGRFKTNGTTDENIPNSRPRKRRRKAPILLIILIVVAVLGGVGAYLWFNPPLYNVTINGVERLVRSGMTIQECLDENYATPTAGNLLAVDGTVFTEGGGTAFSATINGEATPDANASIPRGATVEISNGTDVTEEYTETTQTVAHGTSSTDISSSNTYWAGAIHVYSAGQDGEEVVKTGTQSGKTVTEVTKEAVDEGYSVFSVNTNGDKVIALTFDDGPWSETTDEILDILAENDAKATFFEIGNQCAEYPTQVKRIITEGHQIATHSYDHASGSGQGVNLTFMSSDEQRTEIEKGFSAIEAVTGTTVSRVMRAPGGNYYGSIVTNLKDLIAVEIGWDLDTEDWRKPGADAIAQVIESAQPGNVILMHDGGGDRSQTVEGLRTALPQLKAQGYSFVTIDELLSTYCGIDTSKPASESSSTSTSSSVSTAGANATTIYSSDDE